MTEEVADIRVVFNTLEELSKESPFNVIDHLVDLRGGIKPKHADNILYLYFYYLKKYDEDTYNKLVEAKDDNDIKQIFPGKIMTSYIGGVKSTCLSSDIFPVKFKKIIDEYIKHIDGL